MKTVTLKPEQWELGKLIEEACAGAPVLLAYGEKVVKLEPFTAADTKPPLHVEENGPELEQELLKGVRSKFTPYSREELDAIAERVRREKMGSGS